MTCVDEGLLAQYVDKELEPRESAWIAQHLTLCSQCMARFSAMERENQGLRDMMRAPQAPDLAQNVLQKLALPTSVSPRSFPWWLSIAASFLVAVLLFSGLFYRPLTPQGAEETVVLCSARVEGETVAGHIYYNDEPDIQFIWLEKENTDR